MSGAGFAGYIGFAKESSGGTPVTATDFIEAFSESLSMSMDRFETANIVGGDFYEADDMAGVRRIAGDIVFAAHPEELGFFLRAAMGVQSNTVVESGFLHTHEFTMRTTDFDQSYAQDPHTFEIFRDVTSAHQYYGGNINALQMNAVPNQDLRVTASVIAKGFDVVAAQTPTFTNSPVNPLAFDTCSVSIGGSATELVEALTVSIDSQLEGIGSLNNSTLIRGIRRSGPQMIRVNGTIAFENLTEYARFVDQTEFALAANFTRADSFSMLIELPRVIYQAFPLGIGGRERLTVDFTGMGRYHTGSQTAIKVSLTNTTSGY